MDKFDEWKDTNIVEDLTTFLDNVLEYFIRLAPSHLYKAVYSASKERAIGIGTLGYASYLQGKRIPFESGGFNSAASITHMIYSTIKEKAVSQSKVLAALRGEAPDCEGSGMRNSHLLALAPNASSSNMVGVSPSIEPMAYNAFLSEGRAGSFLVKNPRLKEFLQEKGMDNDDVWESIASNKGSVYGLDFLTEEEKSWFKTFKEINPKWVIELAAIRQEHICQSQSLNISVGKDITKEEMSDIHMLAWKKGVKTLYYCRGQKHSNIKTKTSDIQQPLNKVDVDISFTECLSCEG